MPPTLLRARDEYLAFRGADSDGHFVKLRRTLLVGGRIETVKGARTHSYGSLDEALEAARELAAEQPNRERWDEALDELEFGFVDVGLGDPNEEPA